MDAAAWLLRLALMACALVLGAAIVRNCTDALERIAYGTPLSEPSAQPTR